MKIAKLIFNADEAKRKELLEKLSSVNLDTEDLTEILYAINTAADVENRDRLREGILKIKKLEELAEK